MKSRVFVACFALASALLPTGARAGGATSVARVPASHVGQHGPTSDYASGDVGLVGKTSLGGLGNNGGLALIGNCAYVGRWHDYGFTGPQMPIQVVDVSKPSSPRVLVPSPFANLRVEHAVQREIRAIDLPNFKMLSVLTFSKYTDEGAEVPGLNAISFYGFKSGNCTKPFLLGRYNMDAIRPHEFFQWLDPVHRVDGHPRVLEYVTTPLGGVDGLVVDASHPAAPQLIGAWHGAQPLVSLSEPNVDSSVPAGAGRYSHSISLSADGKLAYISQWDGGYFTMDSSAFADGDPVPALRPIGMASVPLPSALRGPGNTHSAVRVPGTNDVVTGDELYVTAGGCPFGWMRVVDTGSLESLPSEVGSFKLPENDASACNGMMTTKRNSRGDAVDGTFTMHNQTVTSRFVITSWYGGGLRVIDIANRRRPTEAGFFVPKPITSIRSIPDTTAPVYGETPSPSDDWWVATWSYPIVRNNLIYVVDMRSGLYILRGKPGTALARNLAKYRFLEGNSNLGDFVR